MGDGVGVDTRRDVVFVENNIVRERLVVHELNSFALGNGDGVRLLFHSRHVARNTTRQSSRHRVCSTCPNTCGPVARAHIPHNGARLYHYTSFAHDIKITTPRDESSSHVRTHHRARRTKNPSSPLSPPSLMVAANAGEDNARVVAATTAACAKANEKYTVHTYASVSFFCARGARGARGRGRARGVASASPAGYRAWG